MKTHFLFGAVLVPFLAVGQTSTERTQCTELNEFAMARAAANQVDQAEAAISAAVLDGKSVCAGAVSGNVATVMSDHGRIREAEAFAARSIELLRKKVNADDPMLLRPLHALAMARLAQGEVRRAEQVVEQMLQVRAERPEDRGQIHMTGGVLRHMEGRLKEAEAEYLLAYEDWKQFGKPGDVNEAVILNYLGVLYLTEARFEEATHVLDRALVIVTAAGDAFPLDRVELLNARAAVHARQGEWREAEEKLRLAISIADGAGLSEPVVLRSVLENYAIVLSKNHRRKEARVIESRASALPRDPAAGAVVDVRELSKSLSARQR